MRIEAFYLLLFLLLMAFMAMAGDILDDLFESRDRHAFLTSISEVREFAMTCQAEGGTDESVAVYDGPEGQPRKPTAWRVSCLKSEGLR